MPLIGSEAFQQCIKRIDISYTISRLIRDQEQQIKRNPRGHGFRFRSSVQQLRNKVVQIFRDQYDKIRRNTPQSIIRPHSKISRRRYPIDVTITNELSVMLDNYKFLTELALEHKQLPYIGIVDFIWVDNEDVKISDFKSGEYKHEHRDQVLSYVLLLQSNLKCLPKEAFIVYPEKTERVEIDEIIAEKAFSDLSSKITNADTELNAVPATANFNNNCPYCQVRHLCDPYWDRLHLDSQSMKRAGAVDIEVVVTGIHANHGFVGRNSFCDNLKVVYENNIINPLSSVSCGERLRIVGGKQLADEIEIMPWTEVFHL
jgi:CRISPR/Cas system-associated exonuclease Cas4 (RecB family)